LLYVLIAGIRRYLPEVVFLENVPSAATNGQLDLIRKELGGKYHVLHCFHDVSSLGGLIVRCRLYILLVRKNYTLPALPRDIIVNLMARAGPEPARCVQQQPSRWAESLALIGNAAHPASSLAAFAGLAGRLPGRHREAVDLPAAQSPLVRLCFDPNAYSDKSKASRASTKRVRKLVYRVFWSAPRSRGGWGAYVNGFTARGLGDLATQVRYEAGTPQHMRGWRVNPAWVAWLMGFPSHYAGLFLLL